MIEATRRTLELFIEKTETLRDWIVWVNNFGGLLGIFRNSEEEEWRFYREIQGFLNTFRLFIQRRERIALYYPRDSRGRKERPSLLDLPGTSDAWREKVKQAYDWIDMLLAAELPDLKYDDQPVTRWKVLETFLYGHFVHTTRDETYRQWRQDRKSFEELMHHFMGTVQFMFGQIQEVAEASKQELALDEYLERHKE